MQRRVAQALEQAGHIPHALQIYASMVCEPDVLRLLRERGFQLMEQAHEDAVNHAVEALSAETRATEPLVLGLRAAREAQAGRFDRAESLFERAIERSTDIVLRAELAARLAPVLFNQGRDVIPLLEPFAGDQSLPIAIRAKAISFLVPAYANANRADEARAAMATAEYLAGSIESDQLRAQIYYRMGIAALSLVEPYDTVCGLFERAQILSSENALYITAAAAFAGLGTAALFYADDVTKTVWHAQQAVNAALKAGDRFSLQNSLLLQIHIEARRGNAERIAVLEQQFAAATTTDSSRSFYIIPARAMSAAWEGRFEEAYRLLSTVADRSFHNFDRVFNRAIQSLYAVASGKRERAIELVRITLEEIQNDTFDYFYGRITSETARTICAVTEALCGRITSAHRILATRSELESPSVEALYQCALAVCRLVKTPLLGGEVTERIGQLRAISHAGLSMVLSRALSAVMDRQHDEEGPLTRAEIEVLYALSQGQSPKEIARDSGRSVYTIQAHVQNVIRKLGCSGRSEALSVARKKGLLKFN